MTLSPTLDLILNLEVFAFIGLMIWLYFKDFSGKKDELSDGEEGEER